MEAPPVATKSIDNMTRTAREMTEAQRDSYAALAKNLEAFQRRSSGLAQGGLKFFELQEENARAAQEWFAGGVRLLQLQQRNIGFVQDWFSGGVEALREQTEHNLRTADAFVRSARKQQEGVQALGQEWVGAYRDFLSPVAYAQRGLRTAQEATRQGMQATQQVTEQAARQGLRVAEEAAGQTEEVLRQTEKATREVQEAAHEAELQAAVHGALKVANYEELNVEQVSKKLDGLSAAELKKVREYEKKTKDRETLVEQIDRKIKAAS